MASPLVTEIAHLMGPSRWGSSAGLLVEVDLRRWNADRATKLAAAWQRQIPELRRDSKLPVSPAFGQVLAKLIDAMLNAVDEAYGATAHGAVDGRDAAWWLLVPTRQDLARIVARGLESVLRARVDMVHDRIQRILGEIVEAQSGTEEVTSLARAARALGIPTTFFGGPNTLVLGYGAPRRVMHDHGLSDPTGAGAVVNDKLATSRWLRDAAIPCTRPVAVNTAREAVSTANAMGFPVVIKPSHGARQIGVSVGLREPADVRAAFRRARQVVERSSGVVLIEKHHAGYYVRATVVEGTVVSIVASKPPRVRGDGTSTAEQLAKRFFQLDDCDRFDSRSRAILQTVLGAQQLRANTVVARGRWVDVGMSNHGRFVDITDSAHSSLQDVITRTARLFHLPLIGVDLIVKSPRRELDGARDVVVEVNARPAFLLGNPKRDVAAAIVRGLFPKRARDATVPVVVAAPGGGTALRRVAKQLARHGISTGGYANRMTWWGELDHVVGHGPTSAPLALLAPTAEVLLLELDKAILDEVGMPVPMADYIMANVGTWPPSVDAKSFARRRRAPVAGLQLAKAISDALRPG